MQHSSVTVATGPKLKKKKLMLENVAHMGGFIMSILIKTCFLPGRYDTDLA